MTIGNGICECCEETKPLVGVASIPFMPVSIAWCADCLRAGIIPYWAAVNNTAVIGGLELATDEWKILVENTLTYFKKSDGEFASDVLEAIRSLAP